MLGLMSSYDRHVDNFFGRCYEVRRERGTQYNRASPIRDYWVYGIQSIFHCIWAKVLRIRSIIGREDYVKFGADWETLADSLVDITNYSAFLYAENMCRMAEATGVDKLKENVEDHPDTEASTIQGSLRIRMEEHEEKREADARIKRHIEDHLRLTLREEKYYVETVRSFIERFSPSAFDSMERMVLDERSKRSSQRGMEDNTSPRTFSGGGSQTPDHDYTSSHDGACPSCTGNAPRTRPDPGVRAAGVGPQEYTSVFPRTTGEDT